MRFHSLRLIPAVTAATFLAGAAVSCSDTCNENKNALPLAGFYAPGNSTEKIMVDSLEIYGVGAPGDSVLSPATQSKSEVYLPFRIDSDTTRYAFVRVAGDGTRTADTVTFVYERVPRFVNVECGVSYIFDIRDIRCGGVLIDSVTCPGGFIDNTNAENLHIYFAVTIPEPEEP